MSNIQPARTERAYSSFSGYGMVALGILLSLGGVLLTMRGAPFLGIPMFLGTALCFAGLYMLQPNVGAILTLFGQYSGTDRSEGLRWANPLQSKQKISLRARNLNTATLKVNDKRGNPVEIGAAVVWRVRDSAQAVFEIDDYERFVAVQAETAIRHLASAYAYDTGEDLLPVVSALHKIVAGAVGMVEAALKGLSEREIVQLDDERKAAMVSNLLVVLCSDQQVTPVVNTGTLYN